MSMSVDEHCRAREMTFDQLVAASGLAPDRVLAIVAGRWTPSPEERKKVAAALEVAVGDITWGHKTPIQHIYGQGPA
jgi:hypothetical protein